MTPQILLPLFPLPDVVLFPATHLPLHIFEPRYRQMVADAEGTDGLVGMATMKDGAAGDSGPPLHPIGCAGRIVESQLLPDGRSNIVLEGLYRFRIHRECPGRIYRIGEVEPLPAPPLDQAGHLRDLLRERLLTDFDQLGHSLGRPLDFELDAEDSDEALVNQALIRLTLELDDRYKLLGMETLDERYNWLLEHLSNMQGHLDFLEPFRGQNPEFN